MTDGALRPVGISQRVRLEWLDETARLVWAGCNSGHVAAALDEMLLDKVSVGGTARRNNREKTVTILTRIWSRPPPPLIPLRDAGIRLLHDAGPSPSPADPQTVHWGMTMAAYPFWSVVAAQVGRLLRLQGTATAAQINRRVQERYGERPTVARATQRVVRSFVDWGVLGDTGTRGQYAPAPPRAVSNPKLVAWLAEAALHARAGAPAPPTDLLNHPNLFPFRVSYVPQRSLAAASPRLDVVQHGLDSELLVLRPLADLRTGEPGTFLDAP